VAAVPLTAPAACLVRPDDVVYGAGRIDRCGRVGDRTVAAALGWRAGDRLTLTASAEVVVARRDPGGIVTLGSGPFLVIPAALRQRCGLRAGDRVLLAALVGQDALAAYPMAVVDQAIRAWCWFPRGEGSPA
jgi:bifunctional DNA-binding transcriptional regulator/antitoxin component of YhaV-PrlF toxin-antitoxin module